MSAARCVVNGAGRLTTIVTQQISTVSARPAFSLIEVVVVMAIIAALSAIAMPRFSGALARYRADATVHRLVADLELARAEALRTSTSQTVRFVIVRNEVQFPQMVDPDDPGQSYVFRLDQVPYRARLLAATFGVGSDAVFDPYGKPANAGTIAFEVGGIQKTIALNVTSGKATVQ